MNSYECWFTKGFHADSGADGAGQGRVAHHAGDTALVLQVCREAEDAGDAAHAVWSRRITPLDREVVPDRGLVVDHPVDLSSGFSAVSRAPHGLIVGAVVHLRSD